ncbi:MAG: thiolase family protein [Alphaproteobacteria bacterium]|jgi:acetyl-CoA acyltransferase
MSSSAVIAGYVRSPFTQATKGALARVRPDDLAAEVVLALIKKTGVNPADIEDLMLGCAFPEGEQGFNLGRIVVQLAGLPMEVAGVTVNRWCGSSMEAIHMAAGNIAAGKGEVFIAAGVESMSRIPMAGFNPLPNPALYQKMPAAYMSMGLTAENLARQFKIDRTAQEAFAIASHAKAAAADMSGEIVGITTKDGVVNKDGTIRANSTPEDLAKLAPVFDAKGTVTAATSSPLTDGAAAVLVVSEAYAKKHKLPILARITSMAVAGLDPAVMGLGPVHATKKALARAGLSVKDLDIIEINEAFAAQSIPCCQELGFDMKKVNIEGGAIALGHPLGASGARITGKAALLLARDKKAKYALATACIGGGQGIATILEKV